MEAAVIRNSKKKKGKNCSKKGFFFILPPHPTLQKYLTLRTKTSTFDRYKNP
jgi:hypothetical protein